MRTIRCVALTISLAGALWTGAPRAQEPASSATEAAPPSPLASCSLRGTIPLNKGVVLHGSPTAESPIATFTGASTPLFATGWPAEPRSQRVRIATSIGQGASSLRMEGWVLAAAIPLFSARDLDVVPRHVAIAKGHRVELRGVAADGMEVQIAIAGSGGQTVSVKVPCDDLALTPPSPVESSPSSTARQWITRNDVIDLYASPGGSTVFTLRLDSGAAQTFWSTEHKGGYLRVSSRGDIALDGWIRYADVKPVRAGELRARYVPPQAPAGSIVRLADDPPIARVLRETPVRAEADGNAATLGMAEPGAEVYVVAKIGAFSSVLPRGLGLIATERKGFWVATTELAF